MTPNGKSRMGLKHFSRIPRDDGADGAILVGDDGHEVRPYTTYVRELERRGVRHSTKERYAGAVARFLDYLCEFGAFGVPATQEHIAEVMAMYPLFLRDGVNPRASSDAVPRDRWISYAREVGLPVGLARNSVVPVLAAVNFFLRVARDEADRTARALRAGGLDPAPDDLSVLFEAIDGVEAWSWRERAHFKQSSVMGAVVRVQPRLERPRGLRNPIKGGVQVDLRNRAFPIEGLADLLAQARSHRDRAYWACLVAGGLRAHEPLNVMMSDINPATGELWIVDPDSRRFGCRMPEASRVRFKGRRVSAVHMWEPLRSVFWEALRDYLKHEFLPTDRHPYLFQRIDARGRGLALNTASYGALEKQFKKAVARAGIPGPDEAPEHVWTLHSLRHTYGTYTLNFAPGPGGPGMRLTQVQQLMGHASPETTSIYARTDELMLRARIAAADHAVYNGPDSPEEALAALPKVIGDGLRAEADRIEAAAKLRLSRPAEETPRR